MTAMEVNFDGLVGPTHNYAGLSFGNVASGKHGGKASSPRKAALQGLEKMLTLHRLGIPQAVLPPHDRPHIPTLKLLGFSGNTDAKILERAAQQSPKLMAAVASASAMWVANAATISPFPDTADGRTHLTPANLGSMFHRAIEVDTTSKILNSIFRGEEYCHHQALPMGARFGDEGAANHSRLCAEYGAQGVELFVYGVDLASGARASQKFPARQTLEASQAIARKHSLKPERTVYAQQNPAAIDAGVFHNDVIAVSNRNLLFFHEMAFANTAAVKDELVTAMGGQPLNFLEVKHADVSLEEAVRTYLFNSQLVQVPGQEQQGSTIIVPRECEESETVKSYLDELQANHEAVAAVKYLDLRESMNNGGGPACLRLRVVMSEAQRSAMQARVILDEGLYSELKRWVQTHYRESLLPEDLADPLLLQESRTALDELSAMLKLGSIYEFQR